MFKIEYQNQTVLFFKYTKKGNLRIETFKLLKDNLGFYFQKRCGDKVYLNKTNCINY